ncbi:MAG: ChaN family lipoprotein [Pseudomonadota bacterium]
MDVVILGENHDNPHHHARQAEIVTEVAPKAFVFEMLTPAQADAHVPGADQSTLAEALSWSEAGWPDFAMYYPIFAAAPEALVFGAGVPREKARSAMTAGVVEAFGDQAAAFGLTEPLDPAQQVAREALQMAAHCDAMPQDLMPGMVDIQRLRDAELARATRQAFEETGGPVVVITGNGHARMDWGMPVYLQRVAPALSIVSLGQGEDGVAPSGQFDRVEFTPAPEREDPCAMFRSKD